MPPRNATLVAAWVLDSPVQLRSLRADLHQAVVGHPPGEVDRLNHAAETMLLVATELASNALKHGLAPTRVQLFTVDRRFLLDIADHDPMTIPSIAATSNESTAGRGLRLAQALCLELGWYAEQRIKHVWATFDALSDGG
jgi:serine/threonine-protein kinase RsbW